MTKFEIIIQKLATLETENKTQTTAIQETKKVMSQHIQSSEEFRLQSAKNTSNISWLKKGILSIFGIIGGIIVWIVSTILLK